MIFQDRKTNYQQIDLVDEKGNIISGERYLVKITTPNEAVEEEGTPLNAANMNKLCQISIGVSNEEVLEAGVVGYDADTRVMKVGDGKTKWQELKGIKRDVNEDVWTYYANGENDNLTLPAIVSEIISDSRLPSNACIKLKVCGVLGVNLHETLLDGNINERTNPKSIFTFEVIDNSADRRVEIDWSDAIIPQITTSTQSSGSLYMAMIRTKSGLISHTGAKIDFSFVVENNCTVNAYGYFGDGINYEKCEANVNSTSNGTGQSSGGYTYGFVGNNCKLNRCKSNTSQVGAGGCSGYYGNKNRYEYCEAVATSETGAGYGFYTNYSTHNLCKSTATHGVVIYGYRGNYNHYVSCEADATNSEINTSISHGFMGENNDYDRCTSKASNKYGYGYSGVSNRYTYCTALGIGNANGTDNGTGVGIMGANSMVLGCTLMGYDEHGLSVYGYKAKSGSVDSYHIIRNCIFERAVTDNHDGTNCRAIAIEEASMSQAYVIDGNVIDSGMIELVGIAPNSTDYLYLNNVHSIALTHTLG
ncbi:MAG: hypothetical protein IKD20_00070 [Clostridia bacterium]|nr:hypothetical protein [Clostridia bacterium]